MTDTCPTCGSEVRIVGETTKHYEPTLAERGEGATLSALKEAMDVLAQVGQDIAADDVWERHRLDELFNTVSTAYRDAMLGAPEARQEEGDERYVVCGVGGFGTFDDYDEARQFAEDEAERMGSDPILQRGEVPIFTVTNTQTVKAGLRSTPQGESDAD